MKLYRLGQGTWVVLAACDRKGNCQVITWLEGVKKRDRDKLLRLIHDWTCKRGPPRHNDQKYKHLRGDVWEFKAGPKRGAELRIVCCEFDRTIVCIEGLVKRDKTPQAVIKRAEQVCTRYKQDAANNDLEIIDAPEV